MLPQPTQEKHIAQRFAEKQIKKLGKKAVKQLAKKGAKLAAKLLKKIAMKFVAVLIKVLLWLVGLVGLPAIGIGILVIICLIVISLAWSFMFGTGEGLKGKDKELYQYIVQQADSTVNMKSEVERPYRVPEKLIAAVVQLEVFHNKEDKQKEIIKEMASKLAPVFEYGTYDEWTEKQVTTCEDGKCKTGDVQRTSHKVSKLNHVDSWNGSTTFTYTPHVTKWQESTKISHKTIKVPKQVDVWAPVWVTENDIDPKDPNYPYYDKNSNRYAALQDIEQKQSTGILPEKGIKVYIKKTVSEMVDKQIEVKTTTKTRQQYFTSSQFSTTDYSKLDSILNSYGLGMNDKKLIEANYLFAGGIITYTEWLMGQDAGGIGIGIGVMPGIDGKGGHANVSAAVRRYEPMIREIATKYGLGDYVEFFLAQVMQESGGLDPDIFQSSEGAGLSVGGITDPRTSTEAAMREWSRDLTLAKQLGLDFWATTQAYNFGPGYLTYLKKNNTVQNEDNAKHFAIAHATFSVCGWRSPACYGDYKYVSHILRYFQPSQPDTGGAGAGGGIANRLYPQIIAIATKYDGQPYTFGGRTPPYFDCSGLVEYVYGQVGIKLIGTAEDQYNQTVPVSNPLPGDLVFFKDTYKPGISHVGIVVNSTLMFNAGGTKLGYADLTKPYWKAHFAGFRRVKG